MTIEQRLAKLERQNRWMKRGGGLMLAAVACVVLMGQGKPVDSLQLAKLTIVNDAGKVVGVWSATGLVADKADVGELRLTSNGVETARLGADGLSFSGHNEFKERVEATFSAVGVSMKSANVECELRAEGLDIRASKEGLPGDAELAMGTMGPQSARPHKARPAELFDLRPRRLLLVLRGVERVGQACAACQLRAAAQEGVGSRSSATKSGAAPVGLEPTTPGCRSAWAVAAPATSSPRAPPTPS